MVTKQDLIKHIGILEQELQQLKREIESFGSQPVSLGGKFPELSSVDSDLIVEAEGQFEKEVKAEINDLE